MSKPARNPPPVSNPSKGHYLKKSPSPTGNKSPPGHPLSSNNGNVVTNGNIATDEYSQRKPLLAQVSTIYVKTNLYPINDVLTVRWDGYEQNGEYQNNDYHGMKAHTLEVHNHLSLKSYMLGTIT